MSYKLISVKCPDCGQTLSIEENRTQAFCTYCGAKVLISNENEYVFRQIDEAGIQQAETDRLIKMRQMQMEEQEAAHHKRLVFVWLASTIILAILGIIGMVTDIEGLGLCLLLAMCVGMWGGIGIFESKKKKRRVCSSDEVAITSAMENHSEKQFKAIDALFTAAGFRNVTAVPLQDLTIFSFGKEGKVDDVTIDGQSDFEEGDIFSKNARVIITYHSKK